MGGAANGVCAVVTTIPVQRQSYKNICIFSNKIFTRTIVVRTPDPRDSLLKYNLATRFSDLGRVNSAVRLTSRLVDGLEGCDFLTPIFIVNPVRFRISEFDITFGRFLYP